LTDDPLAVAVAVLNTCTDFPRRWCPRRTAGGSAAGGEGAARIVGTTRVRSNKRRIEATCTIVRRPIFEAVSPWGSPALMSS
jgi:hypothetical protein